MFHADKQEGRQTDMTKLMVAFCDFENMFKDGFQHSTGTSEHRKHRTNDTVSHPTTK